MARDAFRPRTAEFFTVGELLILICVNVSFDEGRDIYDATRYAWRVDPQRAEQRLVLTHNRGLVVAAYRAEKWVPATTDNFPGHPGLPGRWGFIGRPAEDEVWQQYVGKRVPDEYRTKGAANPTRYCPM